MARGGSEKIESVTIGQALLVDTNITSYLIKEPRHTRAHAYVPILESHTLFLSFMTIAELWNWAEVANWGEPRRDRMHAHLERYIVAHSDLETCQIWAFLMGLSKRGGHNLGHADAWIAATALTRDVPLVSDNVRHFAWIPGLRLLTVS